MCACQSVCVSARDGSPQCAVTLLLVTSTTVTIFILGEKKKWRDKDSLKQAHNHLIFYIVHDGTCAILYWANVINLFFTMNSIVQPIQYLTVSKDSTTLITDLSSMSPANPITLFLWLVVTSADVSLSCNRTWDNEVRHSTARTLNYSLNRR